MTTITTYTMRRRGLVGTTMREFGEPVPEAHLWRTPESSLRVGYIAQTRMGEADFAAAVARYCPADADAIYAAVGVDQPRPAPAGRAASGPAGSGPAVSGPVEIVEQPAPRRGRTPRGRAV